MMRNNRVFVALFLLLVVFEVTATPAHARGGGPNFMDSPGYQRRLVESRSQIGASQPDTKPATVHSGKKKKRTTHN